MNSKIVSRQMRMFLTARYSKTFQFIFQIEKLLFRYWKIPWK